MPSNQEFDLEKQALAMWTSWAQGIQSTITANSATLAVFTAVVVINTQTTQKLTNSIAVAVFLVSLLTSLITAYITKAAGETIMEYHMCGGVETFKEALLKRGFGSHDVDVYSFLKPIPRWRYTVAKRGPYCIFLFMALQWISLVAMGLLVLTR